MFSPGRFQIRSWMFIYVALIAAMLLAGPPVGTDPTDAASAPNLPKIFDSPLLRRDI